VEGDCKYNSDQGIYQRSLNSQKLYELKPNSKVIAYNSSHPLEKKYQNITITINNLGFRGTQQVSAEKIKYRIVILGGSNTFGATVSDDDTYPALLQKILENKYPGKFEVWNMGLNAYVLSQKVAYAEEIINIYDPDMIIIQHANETRRAFYYKDDRFYEHFDLNPELFLENIPLLFSDNKILEKIHLSGIEKFRSYRFIMAGINNIIVRLNIADVAPEAQLWTGFSQNIKDKYDRGLAKDINDRKLKMFVKKYGQRLPIILFFLPKTNISTARLKKKEGLYFLYLGGEKKSSEYFNIHPPSYVYQWYAEEIFKVLYSEFFKKA